jgi:ATP-binding cassette subfamily F protein 3
VVVADSKKRVNPMKVKKLQERLRAVEQEVAPLESEIAQHDAALANFTSMEEAVRLSEIVAERPKQLEARVAESVKFCFAWLWFASGNHRFKQC